MQMVDKEGRLFGRYNIIDVFFCLFIIALIPVFIFGWKAYHRKATPLPPPTEYVVQPTCPNCNQAFRLKLKVKEPYPKNYKTVCPLCLNEIVVNKSPEIAPSINWTQEYHKYLLEESKKKKCNTD